MGRKKLRLLLAVTVLAITCASGVAPARAKPSVVRVFQGEAMIPFGGKPYEPMIILRQQWRLTIVIDDNAKHTGIAETKAHFFIDGVTEFLPCQRVRAASFTSNARVEVDFFYPPDIPPIPASRDAEATASSTPCGSPLARAIVSTVYGTTIARWTSDHMSQATAIEWQDDQGVWHLYTPLQRLDGMCKAESNAFTGHIEGDCDLNRYLGQN